MHNEMCIMRKSTSIFKMVSFANYMYCKILNFLRQTKQYAECTTKCALWEDPLVSQKDPHCTTEQYAECTTKCALWEDPLESQKDLHCRLQVLIVPSIFLKINGVRFEGVSSLWH